MVVRYFVTPTVVENLITLVVRSLLSRVGRTLKRLEVPVVLFRSPDYVQGSHCCVSDPQESTRNRAILRGLCLIQLIWVECGVSLWVPVTYDIFFF